MLMMTGILSERFSPQREVVRTRHAITGDDAGGRARSQDTERPEQRLQDSSDSAGAIRAASFREEKKEAIWTDRLGPSWEASALVRGWAPASCISSIRRPDAAAAPSPGTRPRAPSSLVMTP